MYWMAHWFRQKSTCSITMFCLLLSSVQNDDDLNSVHRRFTFCFRMERKVSRIFSFCLSYIDKNNRHLTLAKTLEKKNKNNIVVLRNSTLKRKAKCDENAIVISEIVIKNNTLTIDKQLEKEDENQKKI